MLKLGRKCSKWPTNIFSQTVNVTLRSQSTSLSTAEPKFSPVLLQRARAIAAEHAKLSDQNAKSYDTKAAKRIGELTAVTNALKDWDGANSSIRELNALLHDPTTDAELHSLASTDLQSTLTSLDTLSSALKTSLIPPHPFASLPCLIEIHPGAGGSEAALFATELLSMYQSFLINRGWRTTLIKDEYDEAEGGRALTDAILEVHHPGSYDTLMTEAGVHRVQRVPATEKKGRTHTSAVNVMVLPSIPSPNEESGAGAALDLNDPNSDYYVSAADVRSETMRARGAGGQHVNTTDSAVRLTHVPTGIIVAMQESRSQHKNREKAWSVLRARLAQRKREEREEEVRAVRRKAMGGVGRTDRGDKVRTYNFDQNRVSDHRSGTEVRDLGGVLAGGEGLERIIAEVRAWMVEGEVAGMIAEDEMKEAEGKGNG
ncbi:MAG: hypothetical protein Q9227_001943 [Pyrenula ochraceoflavens]